jgi:transcription initiation factor TFIIIB Brf1 subunit/transcription initiation factor TFIIB
LQLNLPDEIKDRALYLDKQCGSLNGTTPTVRACCVIIKATETERFPVPIEKVASALGITSVGIRMALERLKE